MFINRTKEIQRMQRALGREKSQLIAVYGRRRCGKSTLLKHALPADSLYFAADLREKPLQIGAFAKQADKLIPGFSGAIYPDWHTLLTSLNQALKEHCVICLDEFPYLVRNSPELPSVLQNLTDDRHLLNFDLILCGSSQQMMHSMVFDSTSPLYGRCDEVLHIKPMGCSDMQTFLNISAVQAIREFSVWGGVPRYWEIRQQYPTFEEAVKHGILDQNSILFEEPERLFLDEMRTSVMAYSILSLIGAGVHRPSEIAARLGKPATQLSRPLSFLANQGYIRREIPFGESPKSAKKSLYRIDDPFLNFYFTFLVPNKSRLEFDLTDLVWTEIEARSDLYISGIWEDLARKSIPHLEIEGKRFNPANRWWGTGTHQKPMEIDLMAISTDGKTLLVGEAKWSNKEMSQEVLESLHRKAAQLPFDKPVNICYVLFQKKTADLPGLTVINPEHLSR